jgi:succinate-semialdehyde dehydrogenase/glutarate-semialdehyde dehydrogenase
LIGSPIIKKITFTGSTVVGKQLAKLAADNVTRATLELGGHAPVIIFEDADLEHTVRTLVMGKYRNSGQVCTSPTRFYVHESVYGKFVNAFAESSGKLVLGDGLEPKTTMGPLANSRRIGALEGFVSDAVQHGAKVKAGGASVPGPGFFFQPTVLSDVTNSARIMNVEPFGPIAAICPFTNFDDVVKEANRLPFGLAAFAFTRSSHTSAAISAALESGLVGINNVAVAAPESPFGGVKESGYGSESGIEGLEAFLSVKTISEM